MRDFALSDADEGKAGWKRRKLNSGIVKYVTHMTRPPNRNQRVLNFL